jgi:mono/diheme cytochrome c family protein
VLTLVGLLVGCSTAADARTIAKKRPDDHVAGKAIWERSCWQCHGEENDGQGPAAAVLPGGVPDLRNTVNLSRHGELIDVILDGRGDMPAFRAELDKHQAKRALIYMQRLDELAADREGAEDTPSDEEAPVDEPSGDDAPSDEAAPSDEG